MPAICPPELFKFFQQSEGWATPSENGRQFLYDAFYEYFEWSDLTPLSIPNLDKLTFQDWKKFEYWCDDIKRNLMWRLVNESDEDFKESYANSTPKKYFKSKAEVLKRVIDYCCDGSMEDVENILYVEIQCSNQKLYLIYLDHDDWTLGHGDTVLVVKSLSELTRKKGFYKLK